MKVYLDIDGVVRDFMHSVYMAVRLHHPVHRANREKEDHWDCLADVYPDTPNIARRVFGGDLCREVYLDADPYEGAIEAVEQLSQNFDVAFCTSQPTEATKQFTLEWLERFSLNKLPVIFANRKEKFPCDVFVEDAPHNLAAIHEAGSTKLLIRMARPWNVGAHGFAVRNMLEARHMIEKIEWNARQK
jgi:5'(3')-deoxyribonucleotidase